MTGSCCCNCFCLSTRQPPEEEPNAFDLTWHNYLLPSCIPNLFKRQQPIRLEDDDELFIAPPQGRAVRGYLDDPNDWEFDSMLVSQEFPEFVTRNPFGKTKKKRKHRKHRRVLPEDDHIFSEEIQDAEFLGDDQIAHLAYDRSKDMDPYGEEGYIENYDRPISQEMQPPPPQKEFYAARTMPYRLPDDDEHPMQHEAQPEASSSSSAAAAQQAQGLLSERLDDLTDKLVYIRQNIMDINKKDDADATTLKTIDNAGSDKTASDMDSIASEALDEYERPGDDDRRRSGASQYRFAFGGGDSPPFGADHHPFSYFTDQNAPSPPTADTNTQGLNLRGVMDLGKRWLGA